MGKARNNTHPLHQLHLVAEHGPQQVGEAKVGPEHLVEVDVGVVGEALPEHEVAQPLLARRPDQHVQRTALGRVQRGREQLRVAGTANNINLTEQ